jgi:hypothetical protein
MTRFKSWDDGATAALIHLAEYARETAADDGIFQPIFESLGWAVREKPDHIHIMSELMQRAGVAALHVLAHGGDEPFSLTEMHRLLVGKQHDYGHENILHFGMVGVAVRLCDKIARLNNLLKRGGEAKHEALTDTYRDILGYAVIALMLEEGSFELELEQDGNA